MLVVSILTQCEHRVLRCTSWLTVRCRSSFNPHPVRTPGATAGIYLVFDPTLPVSILTQCEHRVLPFVMPMLSSKMNTFQSSPSANTGCYSSEEWVGDANKEVSILTQCEHRVLLRQQLGEVAIERFNPHPVRTPGATLTVWLDHEGVIVFQSSPSANTGCYYKAHRLSRAPGRVSILTQCEHRVLPWTNKS